MHERMRESETTDVVNCVSLSPLPKEGGQKNFVGNSLNTCDYDDDGCLVF